MGRLRPRRTWLTTREDRDLQTWYGGPLMQRARRRRPDNESEDKVTLGVRGGRRAVVDRWFEVRRPQRVLVPSAGGGCCGRKRAFRHPAGRAIFGTGRAGGRGAGNSNRVTWAAGRGRPRRPQDSEELSARRLDSSRPRAFSTSGPSSVQCSASQPEKQPRWRPSRRRCRR